MTQEQELLKELTALGILAEPDVANAFEEDPQLLDEIKSLPEKPLIINQAFLASLKHSFRAEIMLTEQKSQISLQDYVESRFKKYETLKEVLLGKMEKKSLVSIGSASDGFAGVIAIVRSVGESEIEIEDTSGLIKAVFSKDLPKEMREIREGDVLGLQGVVNGRKIFLTNVVWPDIEEKDFNKPNFSIAFVFNPKLREEADYSVFVDCMRDLSVGNSVQIKTEKPVLLKISGLSAIVASGVDAEDALKRRYIKGKPFDFVLEGAPDVFVSIGGEKEAKKYKSTSVFNIKPEGTFLLNPDSFQAK